MRRVLILMFVLLSACTPAQLAELQAVNSRRAEGSVPGLRWSEHLGDIAQAYAEELQDGRPLAHNPRLQEQLAPAGLWEAAAENVGCGPSQASVFFAYLQSPHHRENIEDPKWAAVGTGVSVRDGRVCTVQVFLRGGLW